MTIISLSSFKPFLAMLACYFFNPLEVVPRYREPQLQVGVNYSCICLIWDQTFASLDV